MGVARVRGSGQRQLRRRRLPAVLHDLPLELGFSDLESFFTSFEDLNFRGLIRRFAILSTLLQPGNNNKRRTRQEAARVGGRPRERGLAAARSSRSRRGLCWYDAGPTQSCGPFVGLGYLRDVATGVTRSLGPVWRQAWIRRNYASEWKAIS